VEFNSLWLENRIKFKLKAIVGMVVGSVLIISTMLYLNSLKPDQAEKKAERPLSFQVVKNVKTPKKPKPTPKKPPPANKAKNIAPPPALTSLGLGISGVDFNMSAFDPNAQIVETDEDLLGDTSDAVMTSDAVDQKPRVIATVPLQYPARAKAKEIEGYVLLSILVNEDGQVDQVRVLESDPQGTFDDVAIRNIKKWKFEPAKYNGKPVSIWINQPIKFELG